MTADERANNGMCLIKICIIFFPLGGEKGAAWMQMKLQFTHALVL